MLIDIGTTGVTIDHTFRRPTGDAPTITGTPQITIIRGSSENLALTNMASIASSRGIFVTTLSGGNCGGLYNKIRNCVNYGIYAAGQSSAIFTTLNQYTNNGTNIAADAATFAYWQ